MGGFCDRLRSAMAARSITLTRLSRRTGLAPSSIRRVLVEGHKAGMRVDTARLLAEALQVSPAWLAFGVGDMEAPCPHAA